MDQSPPPRGSAPFSSGDAGGAGLRPMGGTRLSAHSRSTPEGTCSRPAGPKAMAKRLADDSVGRIRGIKSGPALRRHSVNPTAAVIHSRISDSAVTVRALDQRGRSSRHVLTFDRSNSSASQRFTYRSGVMRLAITRCGVDLTMQNKCPHHPAPCDAWGFFVHHMWRGQVPECPAGRWALALTRGNSLLSFRPLSSATCDRFWPRH